MVLLVILCINENYNVIGIHRRYHQKKKLNFGSYIKYILEHINYGHILCKYNIEDLNQPIQILNYYYEEKTIFSWLWGNNDNKEEIRNNCEIYINNKKIDFTFNYKFSKKGINKINIKCKKDLTNMSYMFNKCSSLTSLNLSNFNTNNVKNMSGMFNEQEF